MRGVVGRHAAGTPVPTTVLHCGIETRAAQQVRGAPSRCVPGDDLLLDRFSEHLTTVLVVSKSAYYERRNGEPSARTEKFI
jgi:hypothetical protein